MRPVRAFLCDDAFEGVNPFLVSRVKISRLVIRLVGHGCLLRWFSLMPPGGQHHCNLRRVGSRARVYTYLIFRIVNKIRIVQYDFGRKAAVWAVVYFKWRACIRGNRPWLLLPTA